MTTTVTQLAAWGANANFLNIHGVYVTDHFNYGRWVDCTVNPMPVANYNSTVMIDSKPEMATTLIMSNLSNTSATPPLMVSMSTVLPLNLKTTNPVALAISRVSTMLLLIFR